MKKNRDWKNIFGWFLYLLWTIGVPLLLLIYDGWESGLTAFVIFNVMFGIFNWEKVLGVVFGKKKAKSEPSIKAAKPLLDKRYVSVNINGHMFYGHYMGKQWLYVLDLFKWRYATGTNDHDCEYQCELKKLHFWPMPNLGAKGPWVIDQRGVVYKNTTPYGLAGDMPVPQAELINRRLCHILLNMQSHRYYSPTTKEYEDIKEYDKFLFDIKSIKPNGRKIK